MDAITYPCPNFNASVAIYVIGIIYPNDLFYSQDTTTAPKPLVDPLPEAGDTGYDVSCVAVWGSKARDSKGKRTRGQQMEGQEK